MYSDTVTVYNLHNGTWIPAVLKNVDVNLDKSKIIKQYGENSNDNLMLHVRYCQKNNNVYIGKYKYVAAYAGEENTVAFLSGNEYSILRIGSYTDSVKDADYIGGFYNNLSNAYIITSCAIYSVIPHFEISAK